MEAVSFEVPGQPIGYYAQAGRSKWKMSPQQRARTERYRKYQDIVRLFAQQADIKLPLEANKDKILHIKTEARFSDGRHSDPENVHKGIKDALFYGAKGGDKWTAGEYDPPRYDKADPGVKVTIKEIPWESEESS